MSDKEKPGIRLPERIKNLETVMMLQNKGYEVVVDDGEGK